MVSFDHSGVILVTDGITTSCEFYIDLPVFRLKTLTYADAKHFGNKKGLLGAGSYQGQWRIDFIDL